MKMTEFEINKAVAEKLGISHKCDTGTVIIYVNQDYHAFDPCNNIEQAWEIMMKYNICVTKGEFNNYDAVHNLEYYTDGNWIVDTCVSHEKQLVAAMLCFLEIEK